jgi:RecJ-like exonuclease
MERVETVHVQRLHNNQTHQEVETGKKYHALLMGETAQLNPQVKARLVNPMDAAGQKQGAVLVTRTPNGQLEAKYLKGRFELEPETVLVSDLTPQDMNKKFSLQGKIEAIKQTGGPTLFTLFDGSGTLTIKGFISAGARAYPEINEDDVVTTMVQMIEHEGVMEGEILRIQKIPVDQQDAFAKRLQKILYDRSRPDNVPFLVDSPILHKLAPLIEQAVITIKMAIADNRPIILKHHADTDGYSAAMTLQRAMLPLVLAQHNEEKAMWMYYKRTPSKSPYYDYFDATRDIGYSLSDNAKYNQKMPLIIIVDTGSGEEDAFPIQKVKLFGCQVVVIDHHVPGKNDPISKLADAHINPRRNWYRNHN